MATDKNMPTLEDLKLDDLDYGEISKKLQKTADMLNISKDELCQHLWGHDHNLYSFYSLLDDNGNLPW